MSDLLKQLVRLRLPVTTDQKASDWPIIAVDRNSGDIWGHSPNPLAARSAGVRIGSSRTNVADRFSLDGTAWS